ncbi:MAG: methyltransferase [Oceanospirillales bacterium]|nr:methyltransferase [Oceanospirillales bacterium]
MSETNPLHQALMLMQQSAYTSAQAICQSLLERNPNDFNARHLLGVIKMRSGNPIIACKELKRAAELPVAPRFKAQALSNLSLALQQRERFEEALTAIEQALSLQSDEGAFQLNYLNLLDNLERWDAIAEATERFPGLSKLPDAQFTLARAARKRGKTQDALLHIEQLKSYGDLEADEQGEYALAMLLTGNEAQLLAECDHMSPQQLQSVADYMAEEGETDASLIIYRLLLKRDPSHAGARHMIDASCGHIGASAPADYVRNLYDAHAEQFERQLVRRLEYRAPELLVERIAALLPKQIGRVADLGCGSGLLGRALRKHFVLSELLGCDLSSGMLEQARQKGGYDQLHHEEMNAWLARQLEMDLICATDVLIYTGDLYPVLKVASMALKPGGLFAFSVESTDTDLLLHSSGRYRHSETHIRDRAHAAGLELLSCERFPLRQEQGKMISGLLVICRRPKQLAGGEI